jgi:D-amino peptidase
MIRETIPARKMAGRGPEGTLAGRGRAAMKVYVSADIEGVAGIAHWDEASPGKPDHAEFRERMTDHVAAACQGALAAGATEILVRDAHGSGRNVLAERLPREAQIVRGWSRHPLFMVQELDGTFDALVLVGYHARAGSGGNPLAHTFSSSAIARMEVNGRPIAELHLNAWAGAMLGVPLACVSGDEAVCAEARKLVPAVRTAPVLRGVGASTISVHPEVAAERIRTGVEKALRGDLAACAVPLPERFELVLRYKEAARAYRGSFYPGARLVDDETVAFETSDYFEVLRALAFVVY